MQKKGELARESSVVPFRRKRGGRKIVGFNRRSEEVHNVKKSGNARSFLFLRAAEKEV